MIVKLQVTELVLESVAVQVTTLVPGRKRLPDGGLQASDTSEEPQAPRAEAV